MAISGIVARVEVVPIARIFVARAQHVFIRGGASDDVLNELADWGVTAAG